MNIVLERAAVFSDREKDEIVILMDGFRIVLSGNEARALSLALTEGLMKLNIEPQEHYRPAGRSLEQAHGRMHPQLSLAGADANTLDAAGRPPHALSAAVPPQGPELARMLAASNAGVIVIDPRQPDDPIVFANGGAAAMTGYAVAELVGQSWRILFGPATDPQALDQLREARQNGRPISLTLVNYRKDRTPFWVRLDLTPVRGQEQSVQALVGVFLDISEQRRHEEEAQGARAAAERANQAKSEFIAGVSHDLRTAMTGLIGFTNLLLNEKLSPEQRRYAVLAREAGNSLLAVINDVLDLSKIEAGKLELAETDFSVIELAVSCHAAAWQAAREKGLDLNFVLKPDVPNLVRGDPDSIRRVLLNLLNNAIKFTERGNVVLSLSKVEDGPSGSVLKFSVTDTGVGIPKDKQDLLFRRFSQVEGGGGRRQQGGTGLGLAISKSLVEQMGGAIGVTSTPEVGSQFWFTLPLKVPASALAKPATSAGLQRKARILVAEDTPINQELMVTLLRRAGHDVDLVTSGEAAVAAVQRQQYDLILMDVQLPRMDGFAATRAIRALGSSMSAVPIIALTARALARDVEDCLAAGMNDHLSKPIDAALLLSTVEHWTRVPRPGDRSHDASMAVRDEAMLQDLESHLGRDKVMHMIAMAADDIPTRLARMEHRLGDHEFGRQQAHELVSIAGNLGFSELVTRSRDFIDAAADGQGEHVRAAYQQLKSAADRALAVMQRVLRDVGHR